MSNLKHRLVLFFCALALAGCSQLFGETKIIQLEANAPVLKGDENIIAARLRDHTSTFSPAYSFASTGNRATLTARGVPPEASLQFLLRHRGVFEAKSSSSGTWFTNQDIADAQVGLDEKQRTVLYLVLTTEGTARLADVSSRNPGALVLVELDGEELASAQLSGPITGGKLQISLSKTAGDAMLIATILRTGALSFAPSSVQVHDHE